MNILVIGCDQVGASLIRDLERIGHDISLIEKDPEQLKRLDAFDDYSFGGTALVGDPTDPDILRLRRSPKASSGGKRSSAGCPILTCRCCTTRPTRSTPSAPRCSPSSRCSVHLQSDF